MADNTIVYNHDGLELLFLIGCMVVTLSWS